MAKRVYSAAVLYLVLGAADLAMAGADSRPLFHGAASPLFASVGAGQHATSASLFVGTRSGSLFAPRAPQPIPEAAPLGREPEVAQLLDLIARAEAGPAGYDAVQHGARILPPHRPTEMTLGEIYAWIDATPRQPHAIGRYQFIPPTLRRVARIRGFAADTRFTPQVQDALAAVLLEEAGLHDFRAGALDRRQFMRNLARIWAGLPLPSGHSYYHGHAGNRATMTWAAFDTGMAEIWPVRH